MCHDDFQEGGKKQPMSLKCGHTFCLGMCTDAALLLGTTLNYGSVRVLEDFLITINVHSVQHQNIFSLNYEELFATTAINIIEIYMGHS